ncbi:peptidylprolyl isomerase [Roseovarius aestuarii]|uniref:Parvulin-like PPIase n=1 Tax=Roseovarius aestuarii TaxID=475083 RepID=A0A1X7BV08_9RHOB|nr:peptidylprolyl isomerase [Roseovarius aestuarii]SMC13487.1 Foldase protein PrsA 3 precursor [Roseovarius aestuarii]
MANALFPDLIVNGELIPHSTIAAEAQNHSAPRGKPGIAWRAAANALAMRALLLQEARQRQLKADPQEVGPGKFETEEEALIRQLLEAAVETTPPNESELRTEWEKNPDRFRSPPLWEVSHILCACDPRDKSAREKALARATYLTELATRSPTDFAALAARESDCGSKASSGALGQLGPGDTVPEFEAALRPLEEGQITPEPVLSRHGYHIIRLDAVAVGQRLPYAAVRQKIASAIEKSNWVRASRDFVDRLIAAAEISGADLKPQ